MTGSAATGPYDRAQQVGRASRSTQRTSALSRTCVAQRVFRAEFRSGADAAMSIAPREHRRAGGVPVDEILRAIEACARISPQRPLLSQSIAQRDEFETICTVVLQHDVRRVDDGKRRSRLPSRQVMQPIRRIVGKAQTSVVP